MRLAALWRTSPKLLAGFAILIFFFVIAFIHPFIVDAIGRGQNPLAIGAYPAWLMPSSTHLLGTDRYGRDLMAMTVTGLWASLQVGVMAGVFSTFIGILIGFTAGFKGGKVDAILSTTTDMFLVIPFFPLLILLSAYTRNTTLWQVALMLTAFSWPFAARTIRAQVLSLRSRPYVDLARANKMTDMEIIFQELVPNMLPYIGVGLANASLGAIFALVGIEVIGLGPSGAIDLGLMIAWAVAWGSMSLGAWPLFVAPVTVLSLLFMAVNLINVGLEETYNPRLRRVAGA
jgi:peptide/nickel transport system permease protein